MTIKKGNLSEEGMGKIEVYLTTKFDFCHFAMLSYLDFRSHYKRDSAFKSINIQETPQNQNLKPKVRRKIRKSISKESKYEKKNKLDLIRDYQMRGKSKSDFGRITKTKFERIIDTENVEIRKIFLKKL